VSDFEASWLTYMHANGAASDAYTAHRVYTDYQAHCPTCGLRVSKVGVLCGDCQREVAA